MATDLSMLFFIGRNKNDYTLIGKEYLQYGGSVLAVTVTTVCSGVSVKNHS